MCRVAVYLYCYAVVKCRFFKGEIVVVISFNRLTVFLKILCFITASVLSAAPIADNTVKFLGNISTSMPPSNFADYWNQVTLENNGKWGNVQPSQTAFKWGPVDSAYEYCKSRGFPYKHHCFVWGSQYPGWVTGLSAAKQLEAVENWIKAYGERFPETEFIDVVNEPLTTACPFKNALGGDGETGWDWVVTSFELARKYCPNSKLLINEYAVENNVGSAAKYLKIVKTLQEKNLIDGIGLQSHCFNIQGTPVTTIKKCLDTLASSGLPLYSSEFDITGSEAAQLKDYKTLFPAFWEHPAVKGVTLWGWTSNWRGGVIMSGGKELAALAWLRTYVDSLEATHVLSGSTAATIAPATAVTPAGRNGIRIILTEAQTISLTVFGPTGRIVHHVPDRPCSRGENVVPWQHGKRMRPGVYTIVIRSAMFQIKRNVIVV